MIKIETVLIPIQMYRDNDFTCQYDTLLKCVKHLNNCYITNYYDYPPFIIDYLIKKGYAVFGSSESIYRTLNTGKFLEELINLNK